LHSEGNLGGDDFPETRDHVTLSLSSSWASQKAGIAGKGARGSMVRRANFVGSLRNVTPSMEMEKASGLSGVGPKQPGSAQPNMVIRTRPARSRNACRMALLPSGFQVAGRSPGIMDP
jgi:hypothetical protein